MLCPSKDRNNNFNLLIVFIGYSLMYCGMRRRKKSTAKKKCSMLFENSCLPRLQYIHLHKKANEKKNIDISWYYSMTGMELVIWNQRNLRWIECFWNHQSISIRIKCKMNSKIAKNNSKGIFRRLECLFFNLFFPFSFY